MKPLGLVLLCSCALAGYAQEEPVSMDSLRSMIRDNALQDTTLQDTAPVLTPQQRIADSIKQVSDFKEKVVYNAEDSIVFDVVNDRLYLYGNAHMEYETTKLDAAKIRIDWETQTIFAEGTEMPDGREMGTPVFNEGGEEYKARKMNYNFKTQKARIVSATTQQAPDITIISDTTKRFKDGTMYAKDVIFTTCDCEEGVEPDFYFKAKKIKLLPNNQIITGPMNIVLAGFPLPVIIPFGYIPNLKDGQRSGIIFPQYGESPDRGFFLRNLGYYVGLGDNFDLLFDGDIYTRGGWRLAATSNYNVRYKFSGRISFSLGEVSFGERSDPDFSKTREWRLTLSHNQPINPNTRISANVNISSSRFLRELSFNPNDFFQNNLNSSISFQKTFANLPVSLNATFSHRQDLNRNTVSMTLPTLNLTVNRLSPFKNISRKKSMEWLTRIGINYSMQASNQVNTIPDKFFPDLLFQSELEAELGDSLLLPIVNELPLQEDSTVLIPRNEFLNTGLIHRISTSTSIKLLKYINLSGSFNMNEYWYFETLERTYDEENDQVEDRDIAGFEAARDYSTAFGLSTNFYGIYQFLGKKEFAIRQRISPTVAYSFRPDFGEERFGYYDSVQVNAAGDRTQYNRFQNGIFGSPGRGRSQSMSFGLTSVLEMKYRKKESFDEDFPEKEDKYVRTNLLDNLSINSAYNFVADSFNLSNIRINARTRIFEKININAGATLDPYVLLQTENNSNGIRVNRFLLAEEGRLGRLTNAQVSFSSRFKSKKKTTKKKSDEFDDQEFLQVQRNLDEYVDFDVPWSVSLNYNFSYSKPNLSDARIRQTMRMNGDFSFTPKWKIGFSSGYDLQELQITQTNLSVYRDLNCWEMSFTWVPFGTLQSYLLTLNVKSSTLRDLRLTKRSQFQDRRRLF